MLDSGHSREAVLGYELPYLYAFMDKKLAVLETARGATRDDFPTGSSAELRGRKNAKRVVKRMTSQEMAQKLREKQRREK